MSKYLANAVEKKVSLFSYRFMKNATRDSRLPPTKTPRATPMATTISIPAYNNNNNCLTLSTCHN